MKKTMEKKSAHQVNYIFTICLSKIDLLRLHYELQLFFLISFLRKFLEVGAARVVQMTISLY